VERSFAVGVGNTVKIFELLTANATDVSDYDDGLPAGYDPVDKRLILDVGDLVRPDNLEGMTLGPKLPNGSQSLILVSDNNFNPGQITQFILLSLDIESVSD
jgi:glycerophosphoryl diester phosphodiesterase